MSEKKSLTCLGEILEQLKKISKSQEMIINLLKIKINYIIHFHVYHHFIAYHIIIIAHTKHSSLDRGHWLTSRICQSFDSTDCR